MSGEIPYELELKFVELITRSDLQLPPYPSVAMKLSGLVGTDDYSLRDLSETVRTDAALTATVLRLANSANRAGRQPVTDIQAAVAGLGSRELVRLAFVCGLAKHTSDGSLNIVKRLVWRRANLTAELCRAIAPRLKINAEEIFVCGLLVDFGRIVALSCLEQVVSAHEAQNISVQRCLDVVETYNSELGMVVGAKWDLPQIIQETISQVHSMHPVSELSPIARAVRAAKTVVLMAEASPAVSTEELEALEGLGDNAAMQFVAEVLPSLPSSVQMMEPDLATRNVQGHVLEKPRSLLRGRVYTVHGQVHLRGKEVEIEAPLVYMNRNGFGVRCKQQLHEQTTVQVRFCHGDRELTTWGTVLLCEKERSVYRIEVQPFALSTDNLDQWNAVVDSVETEALASKAAYEFEAVASAG